MHLRLARLVARGLALWVRHYLVSQFGADLLAVALVCVYVDVPVLSRALPESQSVTKNLAHLVVSLAVTECGVVLMLQPMYD